MDVCNFYVRLTYYKNIRLYICSAHLLKSNEVQVALK